MTSTSSTTPPSLTRPETTAPPPSRDRPLSARRTIGLVARREITTRVRNKAFIISNLIVLLVVAAGIVAGSIFGGDDDPDRVGFVGTASALSAVATEAGDALGNPIETSVIDDAATARQQVRDEELDAALVPGENGAFTALTRTELSAELSAVLQGTVRQAATDAALEEQGVSPEELAEATRSAVVTEDSLDPPDPDSGQRTAIAYIAVSLLFFQVFLSGLYVAMGVVEEKASRVVELLLSTIPPLHLLVGKILGIGLIGLAQIAAYGAVGVGVGLATGLVTVTGTALAVLASTLLWFVLGYAFFAVLYAAAASLVSRQEDVNSTTTPVNLLAFAMFFAAQFSLGDAESRLATVLAWVPPFSAALMPLRIAAGVTGPAQIIGSALLMLAATAVLAVLGSRIYQRSVLHSGTAMTWKDAFSRSRGAA